MNLKIYNNFLPTEIAQKIEQQIVQEKIIELGELPTNVPTYTNIDSAWFQETRARSTMLVLKNELLIEEAKFVVDSLVTQLRQNLQTRFVISSTRINYMSQRFAAPTLKYDIPHVDIKHIRDNMYTAMYYVNNSHGDTILYNQTCRGSNYLQEVQLPLTCLERIAPRHNRLIIFNANQMHSAPSYSSEDRYIINLNITTEFPLDYDRL
jgi:hypothetical protein